MRRRLKKNKFLAFIALESSSVKVKLSESKSNVLLDKIFSVGVTLPLTRGIAIILYYRANRVVILC